MNVSERLHALSGEIGSLETDLRILDEQIEFQAGVADDARIRSLVSATPLADREAREAADDLERMRRVRAELAQRLAALRDEQDQLLERLLEEHR